MHVRPNTMWPSELCRVAVP